MSDVGFKAKEAAKRLLGSMAAPEAVEAMAREIEAICDRREIAREMRDGMIATFDRVMVGQVLPLDAYAAVRSVREWIAGVAEKQAKP
jgi:hypothetical protein